MTAPIWEHVRDDFALNPSPRHFAAMMVSTHPRPVRAAIARYRKELDEQPWVTVKSNLHAAEEGVCYAASAYFGVRPADVGLVDGTTQGLSLLYSGLKIAPDQEILTTAREFHGALHSLDVRAQQCMVNGGSGAIPLRRIPLFPDPATVTEQDVLDTLKREIDRARTRVLALSWVYSNSGVKLPIARIAALVAEINASAARQDPERKLLFCVDGVVGLGVEDATFEELGCDFFVAGCHKMLYGPRGTGIWAGRPEAWQQCAAIAPTSSRENFVGRAHSPGGIHSYEQRWALKHAFDYLRRLGKSRITARIQELTDRFKAGLAAMSPRVRMVTPRTGAMSSSLVCFDVRDQFPGPFVTKLEGAGILATVAPTDVEIDERTGQVKRTCGPKQQDECLIAHVRVALSIFHLESDVDACLEAIDRLAT
ncbi:MAG TPA: aminotransferase class V-fold PLP-dependent enzyme [Vicinamibacterales bacterium]|nr:aminotransferase class V-fold PLP-dependent enzyme [Vicinamibacterales bacterium]